MEIGRARRAEGGYTYVLLLFVVALLGMGVAGLAESWHLTQQRERERDLLFVGRQYRAALKSYAKATPEGQPAQPERIDDLLEDRRQFPPRRHLRRAYPDPVSGNPMVLVRAGNAIVGVRSASTQRPLMRWGYRPEEAGFADAIGYHQWVFSAEGQ